MLGSTADAVIAIVRSGLDLDSFSRDGVTPLDWLAAQLEAGTALNAGQLGKVLSAVVAAGADPSDFGGADLRGADRRRRSAAAPDASGYLGMALAILALHDAGADIPPGAVDTLVAARTEQGAIGFGPEQAAGHKFHGAAGHGRGGGGPRRRADRCAGLPEAAFRMRTAVGRTRVRAISGPRVTPTRRRWSFRR